MLERERLKDTAAARGQENADATPVPAVVGAANEPGAHASVDETDGALVRDLEPLREVGDPRPRVRESPHGDEQLILHGGDAGAPVGDFGAPQETPEGVTPPREALVVRIR